MKTFVVSARRAAFGWPFYVTWNLVAYAKEQKTAKVAVFAILTAILTTTLWLAAWVLPLWIISQVAR